VAPMKIFYTDHFVLPLPAGHRFPMSKYSRLRERVIAAGVIPPHELREPPAATRAQLEVVHEAGYVDRVFTGTLDPSEQRRIGFPWSAAMVERSRRSVGATIAAAEAALVDGFAVNLAGGTHHAYADHGEGYCIFNDVAVAIRWLMNQRQIRNAVVIDTDVHQGNGTAAIFRDDPQIFCFSVHGAGNFPFRKEQSTLDIALPDRTGDEAYLNAVTAGLAAALGAGPYDIAFYIAGADPHERDRLGRLNVSAQALARRDELVLGTAQRLRLPIVTVMAGGYGSDVEETVAIHLNSVLTAAALALRASPIRTMR
jgi:acetoin utilization deacetylase AcuC-like enzyme